MKKSVILCAALGCMLFSSCTLLDNLANNLSSIANLVNCEYSLKNVSNVSVAGVNVKNVINGNISATDVVLLAAAITNKQVPLALDVNINVKNPTDRQAMLSMMDWALDIAQTQFATGSTTKSYDIKPMNTSVVPLGVSTDLYRIFSKEGLNSLKTFAASFNSEGKSSQVGLKIRPSLTVANQTIKAPDYIQIMKPTESTSSGSSFGTTPSGGVGRIKI